MLEIKAFLKARLPSAYSWSLLLATLIITAQPLFAYLKEGNAELTSKANAYELSVIGGSTEATSLLSQTGALAINEGTAYLDLSVKPAILPQSGAVLAESAPLSNISRDRNGILKYKIQSGDTLTGIAEKFNISAETLQWTNKNLRPNQLRAGQEVIILPVSGILHEIQPGESIQTIASKHGVNPDLVRAHNPNYQKTLDDSHGALVIPYARPLAPAAKAASNLSSLPNLNHYFILPALGRNWGELHSENAVDIADACGNPVYASAEGLVVESSDAGYWNQGYGNYILIEHPNGVKTKYGHNKENLVKIGDFVAQGDKIALIGSTGKTHGLTGCHIHFEVHGAQNPFVL